MSNETLITGIQNHVLKIRTHADMISHILIENMKSAPITRQQFMDAYRDTEWLNDNLSPDDRAEVFEGIMLGSSDFTPELINGMFDSYNVNLIAVQRTHENELPEIKFPPVQEQPKDYIVIWGDGYKKHQVKRLAKYNFQVVSGWDAEDINAIDNLPLGEHIEIGKDGNLAVVFLPDHAIYVSNPKKEFLFFDCHAELADAVTTMNFQQIYDAGFNPDILEEVSNLNVGEWTENFNVPQHTERHYCIVRIS